jgi:hypothetical protein
LNQINFKIKSPHYQKLQENYGDLYLFFIFMIHFIFHFYFLSSF